MNKSVDLLSRAVEIQRKSKFCREAFQTFPLTWVSYSDPNTGEWRSTPKRTLQYALCKALHEIMERERINALCAVLQAVKRGEIDKDVALKSLTSRQT